MKKRVILDHLKTLLKNAHNAYAVFRSDAWSFFSGDMSKKTLKAIPHVPNEKEWLILRGYLECCEDASLIKSAQEMANYAEKLFRRDVKEYGCDPDPDVDRFGLIWEQFEPVVRKEFNLK